MKKEVLNARQKAIKLREIINKPIPVGKKALTINSLSGGKTSSYMAVHYPADIDMFSVVLIDHPMCHPKDKAVIEYCREKIGLAFIGTAESDETLKAMMDLEQFIGREITWVRSDAFDTIIEKRSFLPNLSARFCTTEMKLKPIFDRSIHEMKNHHCDTIEMNIGYRIDDMERVFRMNNDMKVIVGKHPNGNNKWQTIKDWRIPRYPVLSTTHQEIVSYWKDHQEVQFPADNNCEFCFWKQPQRLAQTAKRSHKYPWWVLMEERTGGRFKSEIAYKDLSSMQFTQEIDFSGTPLCSSGGCTD